MSKSEFPLQNAAKVYGTWLAGLAALVYSARTLDRELPLEMISPKEAVLRGQDTVGARFEIAGKPKFEGEALQEAYQNFYSAGGFSSSKVELPVFVYSIEQNFQGKNYRAFITSETKLPEEAISFRVKGIKTDSIKGIKVDGPVFDSEYARVGKRWIGTDSTFNVSKT